MSIYGPQKLVHHLPLIKQIGRGIPFTPVHVQLILSDLCNQSCNFCAYRMEGYTSNQLFGIGAGEERNNNPNRMIPADKVQEILRDCSLLGVQAIQFTGGGEPTVHPAHVEAISECLKLGMQAALVSNGVLWSERLRDVLLGAAWVRVSVDAANARTYSRIRGVSEGHFSRAIGNLRELCLLKRLRGSQVAIGVGFVVTKDNWQEVCEAAKLAKETGADNFRISGIFQNEGAKYFAEFYEAASDLCQQAQELSGDGFMVFNNFTDRVADQEHRPDYERCGYQHLTTYIGGDQNVYRCCNTSYNERGLLGSIKDRSFREFWLSDETHAKLCDFDARGCDRCQFNGQNHFINYALQAATPHVAFT